MKNSKDFCVNFDFSYNFKTISQNCDQILCRATHEVIVSELSEITELERSITQIQKFFNIFKDKYLIPQTIY